MEIYSPKRGDITKFKLNVLKSDSVNEAETRADQDIKIRLEKVESAYKLEKAKPQQKINNKATNEGSNVLKNAVNSFYEAMKKFFAPEEVI